ncbi:MAG TPA: protein kinase [Terriglobia bacterium]|nr:protein kinase [Terriglobia bacterium]
MLTAGTKLGPYEVAAPLGAGGMGEVYRARDTKLGRDVALKVLPAAFANDAERMARFEREAQVLASLNHPNIAAIYGLEESGGVRALVMELVEGETLAERLATPARRDSVGEGLHGPPAQEREHRKGAPLPLGEALPIARQITEALEAAHERGIIHRDLKPANIKITPEGAVKVLDFGLAKALDPQDSGANLANSPTLSPTLSLAATQAGVILGTAAYMAPEQAKGKSVDRRADIWAFGCVLYELLAGQQAFEGETISDVLAAVIMKEPDWGRLAPATPSVIQKLVRRCLQKDPKQRLQAIGEARIAIEETLTSADVAPGFSPAGADLKVGATAGEHRSPLQRALPWALVGLTSVALLVAVYAYWRATRSSPSPPAELSLDIPSTRQLDTVAGPAVVISPDGSRIAYVARTAQGKNQIYLRELDKPEAVPLEGAEGLSPFFSPDGQWIGFYANGKIERISVFGGAPVEICSANGDRGASWSEDGTIVLTPALTAPLVRVSATGGTPQPLTQLDAGRKEITQRWPEVLPGGKAVLFTASANNDDFAHAYVEAASLSSGQAKVLLDNAYFGRYLSSGYLVYVSGGTLFAIAFDAEHLKVTGTAMPVIQNIQADLGNGGAQFSSSRTGTAVYLTGQTLAAQATVALVDRKGAATPLVKQPGDYYAPQFSPDGKQLALQVGGGNTWIYDLARETMTPLTFPPADCLNPVWTPDGKRVACYEANPAAGGRNISWIPADGTGGLQQLTQASALPQLPGSWSPDGKTLAFFRLRAKSGTCCEIWTLPVNPDGTPGEPKPLLGQDSTGSFTTPRFSPDGHWLAYQSTESGPPQVYVVPYPGPGGKRQISIANGTFPEWSKTGHELFFTQGNPLAIVSVSYSVQGNSFQPGIPTVLFSGNFQRRDPYGSYDVAPDGNFAMLEAAGGKSEAPALPTVVMNWFARVRQLVAAGQK